MALSNRPKTIILSMIVLANFTKYSSVYHTAAICRKHHEVSSRLIIQYFTSQALCVLQTMCRVSTKSFPDYKNSLKQNYCTWKTNIFFFSKCNSRSLFLQHISTLQHVLLLLHGERLIDNQFLSTCSPTCLQLLQQNRLLFLPSNFVITQL